MICVCGSDRIVSVCAKCCDSFFAQTDIDEYDGYVPSHLGIGSGDYVKFSYCLNCGKICGDFPLHINKNIKEG
jgi:hypothetical protein